jgi:hypothetical protein
MVLAHVLLRVLPELLVVLALDEVATHARDLLHALTLCQKDPNAKQPLLQKAATPQFTADGRGVASAWTRKPFLYARPLELHHEPITEIHLHRSL